MEGLFLWYQSIRDLSSISPSELRLSQPFLSISPVVFGEPLESMRRSSVDADNRACLRSRKFSKLNNFLRLKVLQNVAALTSRSVPYGNVMRYHQFGVVEIRDREFHTRLVKTTSRRSDESMRPIFPNSVNRRFLGTRGMLYTFANNRDVLLFFVYFVSSIIDVISIMKHSLPWEET